MSPERLEDLLFLCSAIPLGAFGVGLTFQPSLRALSLAARAGLAYGFGALLLTIEALVFSISGIRWSVLGLSAPLLVISAVLAWVFCRKPWRQTPPPARWPISAWFVCTLAALSLVLLVFFSAATSVDFLFFYGVKAVHFAQARGIDLALLKSPFFYHGAPAYPPLMPIVQAWGVLIAGRLPWRVAPMISWIWFLATLVMMPSILRRRILPEGAAAVTAFWAAAISLSFAFSYSMGNGEAPLVFFETLAGAWLLTEPIGESPRRWIPAAALLAATLTKQEGCLAGLFLGAGVLARDWIERRQASVRRSLPLFLAPAAGLAIWFAFQAASGMRVGFFLPANPRGISFEHLPAVLRESLRNITAGSAGLSWLLPALFLVLAGRRAVLALPAIGLTCGLLGILLATYLSGSPLDRRVMDANTMPRAIQPAISVWILGAGLAWFSRSVEKGRAAWPGNLHRSLEAH